jgi:hypothetical protein
LGFFAFFVYTGNMDDYTIIRLRLCSPLFYREDRTLIPFQYQEQDRKERLFCFTLDAEEGVNIDPAPETFPGKLVFSGTPEEQRGARPAQTGSSERFELAAGHYFFVQKRGVLGRQELCGMAVEVQREILWQRETPGDRVCFRYLYEDEKTVVQIWRPYTSTL